MWQFAYCFLFCSARRRARPLPRLLGRHGDRTLHRIRRWHGREVAAENGQREACESELLLAVALSSPVTCHGASGVLASRGRSCLRLWRGSLRRDRIKVKTRRRVRHRELYLLEEEAAPLLVGPSSPSASRKKINFHMDCCCLSPCDTFLLMSAMRLLTSPSSADGVPWSDVTVQIAVSSLPELPARLVFDNAQS